MEDNRHGGAMTDPRVAQREATLFALYEEPVTLETAIELIDQLAEIETSLQSDPPEVEFGSAEWFAGIEEIPLEKENDHVAEN